MSGSIEELIVRAKPEGIDNVSEKFGQMKTSLEENKEEMMDTADSFGGLQERFQGALGAIVSGLAVAAGGLATQVPILGQLMAGLGSVASALAFQVDQVLRPVLTPLSQKFFELSEAIFNADGIIGDLIGGVTAFIGIAATVIAVVAKVGALFGVFASTGAGVVSILGTIVSAIATVGAAIISLPALIIAAIAAIIAFAAAYLTNFRGTRDKTDEIIGEIIDFVVGGFNDLVDTAINIINDFVPKVISFFIGLTEEIAQVATDLFSIAVDLGTAVIKGIISGLQSLSNLVLETLIDIVNGTIEGLNTIIEGLPDRIQDRLGVETFSTINADDVNVLSDNQNNQTQVVRGQTGSPTIRLDGRRLDEQTGRYSFDRAARR
jgi:phage-related protein